MCSAVINNSNVNSYTQKPTPTPTWQPSSQPASTKYSYAAKALLETVDLDLSNIHKWAIMDSGATSHFLVTAAPTTNRQIDKTPLRVRLPDGGEVSSSHTCDLDIPALPSKARIAHIIPGLASHSLLSVVKLCNAGCAVEFTKIAIFT